MNLLAYDVDSAVLYLRSHALTLQTYLDRIKKKTHKPRCAAFVREAIEAGGIVLERTGSAKDYGHSLLSAGFQSVLPYGALQAGDVVVIQGFGAQCTANGNVSHSHVDGHMAMFDGIKWISDFIQTKHSRPGYPGKDYDIAQPPFVIYRFPESNQNKIRPFSN